MLTVDIGNTSIGIGRWRGADMVLTRCTRPEEAAAQIDEHAVAITVSGDRLVRLQAALERLGRPPVVVLQGCPLPVIDQRLAQTAGSDRLAAALAASPGPAVVVDAGTAVTVDAIGPDGIFRGGFIGPGLGVALEGLARAAPALPRISGRAVRVAVGLETVSALEAGAFGLLVGGVDRLVEAATSHLAPCGRVALLATGGWGAIWAGASHHAGIVYSADLVHRGIRRWAESGAG